MTSWLVCTHEYCCRGDAPPFSWDGNARRWMSARDLDGLLCHPGSRSHLLLLCCPPSVRWSWGICRASDLRRPREEVGQRLTATIQLQTASPSLHPVEVGGEIRVLSLTFFLFPNSLYCPILFMFTRQRRS